MKKISTLFILITLFSFTSCNDKDGKGSSNPEELVLVDPTQEEPLPVPVPPPAPTPTPEPAPEISTPDPLAGKVSLWKRSTGYDAAIFFPADYGTSRKKLYPLILSLHGLKGSVLNVNHTAVGGGKTGFIKQVWDTPLAKTYPAIVIAPDESPVGTTTTSLWSHSKLRALLLEALDKYPIDPDRVVVTGLSAGSIASQELVKYSKDLIAAAMPGAYKDDYIQSNPCALADIPVWVFGNSSDSLFGAVEWQSTETKINSCSNYTHDFTLTVYQSSCGHGCWDSHWAKPEVQQWLIEQRK